MRYYADIGPGWDAVRYGIDGDTADVRSDPGSESIGTASCVGRAADGRSLWWITIRDVQLPGLFVIVDREFRPAQ